MHRPTSHVLGSEFFGTNGAVTRCRFRFESACLSVRRPDGTRLRNPQGNPEHQVDIPIASQKRTRIGISPQPPSDGRRVSARGMPGGIGEFGGRRGELQKTPGGVLGRPGDVLGHPDRLRTREAVHQCTRTKGVFSR